MIRNSILAHGEGQLELDDYDDGVRVVALRSPDDSRDSQPRSASVSWMLKGAAAVDKSAARRSAS